MYTLAFTWRAYQLPVGTPGWAAREEMLAHLSYNELVDMYSFGETHACAHLRTRAHTHIHTPPLHVSARSVLEACFTYRLLIFCMLLLITFTGCEIGDAGATQLADALQRNSLSLLLILGVSTT